MNRAPTFVARASPPAC